MKTKIQTNLTNILVVVYNRDGQLIVIADIMRQWHKCDTDGVSFISLWNIVIQNSKIMLNASSIGWYSYRGIY